MKSVLISIKPKWCGLIASGKKIIEIRKTKPKIDAPFKCYIYCTKHSREHLVRMPDGSHRIYDGWNYGKSCTMLHFKGECNSKVIGEFVCDRIRPIAILAHIMVSTVDCMHSCLSACEILEYADGKTVYGWHISNLKIYDKPKELSEFGIKRSPQSWCYVEEVGE